jgi:hypothetical protein
VRVATDLGTEAGGLERVVGRPTLSVTCMTAGAGARVAALLRLLRPIADEIVVALDDRADAESERALASIADELVRFAYREPVDRPRRWLYSLPRGDWHFNIDSDEIPSAELLEQLPELIRARDVTHYWIRRPWLWPSPERVIVEQPWSNDYQLRLVLNDPRLLSFPSEMHLLIEALGPHRFVRAPLYHADALVTTRERREAKARKYEALRPGKRVVGGPLNHVFYLPELRPSIETEPLPERDAMLVRAVLEATMPPLEPVAPAATVSAEEIDALWAGRELAESDYRARIELLEEPRRLRAGSQRTFDVRVDNFGGVTWPWGHGEPEVRLSYRWPTIDGIRTTFPAEVPPGASIVVPLHVRAPQVPGHHRLRIDLVHEHHRWFGCALERDVEVEAARTVAFVGRDEALLELLTEEEPWIEALVLASEPPPRYGPPQAPDLREYLLDGTRHGRRRDFAVLAARTVSLLRAARRLRAGEPARPLLRGGQEFLEAVAGCTELRLVGEPLPGLRELWLRRVTIAAARALGVEVARAPRPARDPRRPSRRPPRPRARR